MYLYKTDGMSSSSFPSSSRALQSAYDYAVRMSILLFLLVVGVRKQLCLVFGAFENTTITELKENSPGLPSCIDWIQANQRGNFPEESHLIEWSPKKDGSFQVNLPETCELKRFTGAEAQECLANQHLIMAGDSLSRYQFLDLAYLMEHGEYPPNFGRPAENETCTHFDENGNPTCSEFNNFLWYKNYGSWENYHVDIGGRENGGEGPFNGRLECQCTVSTEYSTLLLRYVSKKGTHLTFLKETGWGLLPDEIRGWKASGCAETGTCSYSLEHGEDLSKTKTRDFMVLLEEGIRTNGTIREQFPDVDHVVYNRGIWGGIPVSRAKTLFPRINDWAKKGCYYKSTTATTDFLHDPIHSANEAVTRQVANAAGCTNYHLHHLTSEFAKMERYSEERDKFYVDFAHFQPWVYHEFNDVMLNMLCANTL